MKFIFVGGKAPTEGEKLIIDNTNFKSIVNPFNMTNSQMNHNLNAVQKTDYNKNTIEQSKMALISIIDGLKQKDFGHATLRIAIKNINEYKTKYIDKVEGSKLFIDSGGYSIIVGDVPPTAIGKFIELYNYYLKTECDNYDYMFSLDIPVFLAHPKYNTKQHIEDFNRLSLTKSVEVLNSNPDIINKFYFIYQFKIKEQYTIWRKLYKELDLHKYIRNWAIGGMVGLRGILRNDPESTDINFSPFTALSYRSFFDYLNSDHYGKEFRLHNLGVYIKYDRFQICLLERLFKRYISVKFKESEVPKIEITYDSVNYMRTAQLKVRELQIFDFDESTQSLNIYPSIQSLPEHVLRKVYNTDDKYNDMMQELVKLDKRENLINIDTFTPLNVFGHVTLDKYFDWIIEKYGIDDMFFKSKDYNHFVRLVNPVIHHLEVLCPIVFTSKLIKCLKENLRITYVFHTWYMNDTTEEKLDKHIYAFIDKIGFPGGLN